jgi:Fur family ferric uptake transcriptional regulator
MTMSLFESALRARGHRVTRPRRVVWEVLNSVDTHLSAPEIIDLVRRRDPSINASSTYRALALLEELGLVRVSRLSDEAATWETSHADSLIHLLCSRCGKVLHYRTDRVEQLAEDLVSRAGFHVRAIDVRVEGWCRDCTTAKGIPESVTAAPQT